MGQHFNQSLKPTSVSKHWQEIWHDFETQRTGGIVEFSIGYNGYMDKFNIMFNCYLYYVITKIKRMFITIYL
jgi:hypothetical protein